MPKYLAKSADVLNEADDFEKRLAYQLFVAEQDARLFGPTAEGEWRPGDPLFKSSLEHITELQAQVDEGLIAVECCLACHLGSVEDYEWPTNVDSTYVRPMIEDFTVDVYRQVRCVPCQVYWADRSEPCWVCGDDSMVVTQLDTYTYGVRGIRWGQSMHSTGMAIDLNATAALPDPAIFARITEAFVNMGRQITRAAEFLRSIGFDNGIEENTDIWEPLFIEWRPEPLSFEPETNVFRIPVIADDVMDLRPRIADEVQEIRYEALEIPANVDLSGRREPRLPGNYYNIDFESRTRSYLDAMWVEAFSNDNRRRS